MSWIQNEKKNGCNNDFLNETKQWIYKLINAKIYEWMNE